MNQNYFISKSNSFSNGTHINRNNMVLALDMANLK